MQILPHQQEENQLIGKNSETGNHIIKVHVLSNIENGNGCTVPYNDIKELPEPLLNEMVGLPVTPEHNNLELDELFRELESQGKTDCEIRQALIEKSRDGAIGTLFDIQKPSEISYNSVMPDLHGYVEITNKEENDYISVHKKPSKLFTSIALFGPVITKENGKKVYKSLNEIRPFHISFANNPAFGKVKALIRGVCKGTRDACRKELTFSSILNNESINTNSNVNNNMSQQSTASTVQQQQEVAKEPTVAKETISDKVPQSNIKEVTAPAEVLPLDVLNKFENPLMTEQENKAAKESKNQPKENKEQEPVKEENKEQETEAQKRIAQLEKSVNEGKRVWREDFLESTIDQRLFKNEEDFTKEREHLLSVIEKYDIDRADVKWFVAKAYPKLAAETSGKKTMYNSRVYNPEDVTKSTQYNETVDSSKKAEDDLSGYFQLEYA